jgi:phosphatidylglycerol:prolipoprotein diacylglycerol transferase
MYPFLYQTETNGTLFRIPTYGLLVLLGFAAAFTWMNWRGRQIGIAPERLIPIYIASAVGGIIGARLLYAFAVEPVKTLTDPLSLISSAGGLAFYGGLLGGAVATLGVAAATKLPGWKLLDLMAPALMLGQGIGRLGCFFAGCCHGSEAPIGENPIAMLPDGVLQGQIWLSGVFPFVTLEFDGGMVRRDLWHVPLYPSQLASAFYLLTLAALGTALWSRRKFDGMIAGLILLVEPICRFLVESYRADERGYAVRWAVDEIPAWLPPGFSKAGETLPDALHPGQMYIGLTTSQGIGLAIVLVAIGILLAQRNKGVAEEIALPEEV